MTSAQFEILSRMRPTLTHVLFLSLRMIQVLCFKIFQVLHSSKFNLLGFVQYPTNPVLSSSLLTERRIL